VLWTGSDSSRFQHGSDPCRLKRLGLCPCPALFLRLTRGCAWPRRPRTSGAEPESSGEGRDNLALGHPTPAQPFNSHS
jgi:hypothetical protein